MTQALAGHFDEVVGVDIAGSMLDHARRLNRVGNRCRYVHNEAPNLERFPCLELAYRAAEAGGSLPAVMSAANEEVVGLFLAGKIGFAEIPRRIRRVMDAHQNETSPSLDAVLRADAWARRAAREA